MISFGPHPAKPKTLNSKGVLAKKRELTKKATKGEKIDSKSFDAFWQDKGLRETLWKHQNGKCCYCERKREILRESDVEHFRPKAGVTEEKQHPGYWWLAYEWKNYLCACKPCNQGHKKNHFPLLANGKRAWKKTDLLKEENPALLNPMIDDPELSISFAWLEGPPSLVKAVPLDERGEKTILLAQLNRIELVEERGELHLGSLAIANIMNYAKIKGDHALKNEYGEKIRKETSKKNKFAGFRRAFFKAQGLKDYLAKD